MWGYSDLVRDLGGDPAAFLKRFHLPSDSGNDPEAFVSLDAFVRLLEATATELACPDFGLRLAAWQGMDILGPVAVIARNAPTVIEAWEAIARYLHVHSPALHLSLAAGDRRGSVRLVYEMTDLEFPMTGQGYELSMANGVRILQLLAEPGSTPTTVSFLHAQLGPDSAYRDALGCPVRFGQPWCGFEISRRTADRPIDTADPETRRIATQYLESQYMPSTAKLSERVTQLARQLLAVGHCTTDAIAAELSIHPRTLQRQLSIEGLTCQELVDRERKDQAARYLADPRLQLSHVAALLGYAEQSTFNRSFRRWFGLTPRQYRSGLR
jgi:AraC-like DNA-binding protein